MTEWPSLLKSTAKVRFQDCDPYNHLNHIKYLDYFVNAREDQVLDAYDMDIYTMGVEQGIGWVVVQNQIAYLRPANVMDSVVITSKVIRHSARSMVVEYQMLDSEESNLKSVMWSHLAHIDMKTGKSIEHNDAIKEMFAQVLYPVKQETFNERLKAIRSGGQ